MASVFYICASDRVYVEKLVQLFNEDERFPYTAEGYTDPSLLAERKDMRQAAGLLIEEKLLSELSEQQLGRICHRYFVLSEMAEAGRGIPPSDSQGVSLTDPVPIFRYQHTEKLKRELLAGMEGPAILQDLTSGDPGLKILGVYSPIGRCGKTTFCFHLARALSGRGHAALYLNLEEYHDLMPLLSDQSGPDLCDLLFLLRNQDGQSGGLLQALSGSIICCEGTDLIPPPSVWGELRDVSFAEWQQLIEQIRHLERYDCLILDLGPQLPELSAFFQLCHHLYVPSLETTYGRAKLALFQSSLSLLGLNDTAGKISILYLPSAQSSRGQTQASYMQRDDMMQYAANLLDSSHSPLRPVS